MSLNSLSVMCVALHPPINGHRVILYQCEIREQRNIIHSPLTQGFFEEVVCVFILVDCVPPFLPCFSEIISEVILVKSIFHWKDSQSIISGNNSQSRSMNVHCIIPFLCLFVLWFFVVVVLHFNLMMLLFYHHKSLFHKSLHQNVKGNELDGTKKDKGESQSLNVITHSNAKHIF